MTPTELIERLRRGAEHAPEPTRAAASAGVVFDPPGSIAPRERPRVGTGRPVREGSRLARERVVIAIEDLRNPERVVRAGKRIADRRHAPWTVVCVDAGRFRGAAMQERLQRMFRLAERLGGEAVLLRGPYADAEILAYARDHNATSVVIGRPRERLLAGFFRPTLAQRLLRSNEGFDVTVVGAAPEDPVPWRRRWTAWFERRRRSRWHQYPYALIVVAICTAISAALALALPLAFPYLLLIFLTGVLMVAARTSLIPALVAAVAGSVAFNFFFMDPVFGFAIFPIGELIAILLFMAAAVFGSHLANRLRAQVAALRATNAQSQALLALSKALVEAPELTAVCRAAVKAIAEFERVPVCLLTAGAEPQGMEVVASAPPGMSLDDDSRKAALWTFEQGRSSGYLSETGAGLGWRFVPLALKENRYGALGVKFDELPIPPGSEQLLLLDALANQVTLSLARTRLASNLEQAKVAEETERLRSALLSSVSHDLRTPLASMIGSASTLRDLGDGLSDADKDEMLDAVLSEGRRLNRYIENLLDMTRLGCEPLKVQRDWTTLADVVGCALHRTRELLAGLTVVRDIPDDLPLLYVNPALIEQALVNVIENAARFSPVGGELRIAERREDSRLLVAVTDQGPGIAPADRQRVFDMFFSGEDADTGRHGSGLGLAICQGIIEAHGGSIEALAGPEGRGTTIAIRLPIPDIPEAPEGEGADDDDR